MTKPTILYSVVAHESPECVLNMYENIVAFNKQFNVIVVFHTNALLMEACRVLPKFDNLLFNPETTVKERFTSSIFLAHMSNYRFMIGKHFDFFCTLASNCMFVGQVDPLNLRKTPQVGWGFTNGYKLPDPDKWQYQEFVKHTKLNAMFKEMDMELVVCTHEGAYFSPGTMWIMNLLTHLYGMLKPGFFAPDTLAAEEIVLPSLEKYITGTVSKRYCGWIPNISLNEVVTIAATGTCKSFAGHYNNIVKVPRDMNNPIRQYINQIIP